MAKEPLASQTNKRGDAACDFPFLRPNPRQVAYNPTNKSSLPLSQPKNPRCRGHGCSHISAFNFLPNGGTVEPIYELSRP